MRPTTFKEHNYVLAKLQPEYNQLPVCRIAGTENEMVSCYRLTFKERLRVLFLGKIWHSQFTFNRGYAPTYLTTFKTEVIPQDIINTNTTK